MKLSNKRSNLLKVSPLNNSVPRGLSVLAQKELSKYSPNELLQKLPQTLSKAYISDAIQRAMLDLNSISSTLKLGTAKQALNFALENHVTLNEQIIYRVAAHRLDEKSKEITRI